MSYPTKQELSDIVQTVVKELYTPHVFIDAQGNIGIAIGRKYKGLLTEKQIMDNRLSAKGLVGIIKKVVEGQNE